MKIHSYYILFALLIMGATVSAQQNSVHDAITGLWTVQGGSAKVKIEKINGKYCGKMVWIKNPNDKYGKPLLDSKNPDPALRNRPQLGLALLENFVADGDREWNGGTIYDPDGGKVYSCNITMKDAQTIEVRGYVGISLFGRTETWKRSSDLTMK